MAEEFVNREEFNMLKKDVEKIKDDMVENTKVLGGIDKKLDVITERLVNTDKISDLKLEPIENRLSKLENAQSWLWRTVGTTLIGILFKIIFDVSKLIK